MLNFSHFLISIVYIILVLLNVYVLHFNLYVYFFIHIVLSCMIIAAYCSWVDPRIIACHFLFYLFLEMLMIYDFLFAADFFLIVYILNILLHGLPLWARIAFIILLLI